MDQGNEPPNQTFFGAFEWDDAIQCVVYMDGLYHQQAKQECISPQDDTYGDEAPPAPPHNKHSRPQNTMGDGNMPQAPPQQQQNDDSAAEAGAPEDHQHQQHQHDEAEDESEG